jgi:hypothetical protein
LKNFTAFLSQIIAQLAAAARMAQAAQGHAFNLADALARQAELLPYFLQRVGPTVHQPETQPQDAGLARAERAQHLFHFIPQQILQRRLRRRGGRVVFDEGCQFVCCTRRS